MSDAPAARLSGVRFAYAPGAFELAIDELSIARRERVACVGPSGSGKTTLIDLIAGVRTPDAGGVWVGAEEVSAAGDAARRAMRVSRIGLVFQTFELIEYLSGEDNIVLPTLVNAQASGRARRRAARERARELADRAGVSHCLRRRPERMSQGERQRVAICRALVVGPELVLCDEPTAALDPTTSGRVMDLLFDECARVSAALMVVTHDHALLPRFERVIDLGELNASSCARSEAGAVA